MNFQIDHLPSEMAKIDSFKQENRGKTNLKPSLFLALLVGKNLECPGDADGHNGWPEVATPCFLAWMRMMSVTEPHRVLFFCGSGGTLSPPTGQLVHKVVDDGPRWSGLDCDDWGSVLL